MRRSCFTSTSDSEGSLGSPFHSYRFYLPSAQMRQGEQGRGPETKELLPFIAEMQDTVIIGLAPEYQLSPEAITSLSVRENLFRGLRFPV
ncbi:hypothetical protein Tco_0001881 [Tanacetum coccineum]